jgi:hypothetical protein
MNNFKAITNKKWTNKRKCMLENFATLGLSGFLNRKAVKSGSGVSSHFIP